MLMFLSVVISRRKETEIHSLFRFRSARIISQTRSRRKKRIVFPGCMYSVSVFTRDPDLPGKVRKKAPVNPVPFRLSAFRQIFFSVERSLSYTL